MSDGLSDTYDDGMGRAFQRLHDDADTIRAGYEALPKEWLRAAVLVEYRCPNKRGCLLLHAWRGDDSSTYFYIPSYKMSPARNARESVESARLKNTLDGDRVWRPKAGRLDGLEEWGDEIGLGLECDHLLPVTVTPAEILRDAATATRGKPHRRTITARFA